MPFPDQCSLVANFLQQLWKSLLGTIKLGRLILVETIQVAVLSSKNGSSTWAANRVGHHATGKQHAFLGDAINVWGWSHLCKMSTV